MGNHLSLRLPSIMGLGQRLLIRLGAGGYDKSLRYYRRRPKSGDIFRLCQARETIDFAAIRSIAAIQGYLARCGLPSY
jgi:hypothetical protein